jgi:hypothetical protein
MATCGFCKKKITKEEFKNNPFDTILELRYGAGLVSCPHCDSVLGAYYSNKAW